MPDLPSPTALVFVGLAGGDVEFYGGTEGQEAAVLVALSLGVGTTLSSLPSLVPLQESSLALVGTLLVVTVESSANGIDLGLAETEAAISLSSGAGIAVGQSLLGQSSGYDTSGAGAELPAQHEPAPGGAEIPSTPGWMRFLLGTDEAIERFNREHPDLSPPRSDATPATSPAGVHSEFQLPGLPLQDVQPGQSTSWRDQQQTEAIDGAIERLDDDDRLALGKIAARRVGETHQRSDDMRNGMVGFTHPTICIDPGSVHETRSTIRWNKHRGHRLDANSQARSGTGKAIRSFGGFGFGGDGRRRHLHTGP